MPTRNQSTPDAPVPTQIGGQLHAGLLDELDRDKVAWQPEPGSKVAGIVMAITTAKSEFGDYPLITLDPGPTEPLVDVHCFHTWLKSDVTRLGIRQGDQFAVKYLGRGGDRDMAMYRVSHRATGSGKAYQPTPETAQNTERAQQLFEEPF